MYLFSIFFIQRKTWVPWLEVENEALNNAFANFIKEKRYPQHHDILLAIKRYKTLEKRGIEKVKSKIKTVIRKLKT